MNQPKYSILETIVSKDPVYQELLSRCTSIETEYLQVINSLPSHSKELIEDYITLCEELDYRRLTIALTL